MTTREILFAADLLIWSGFDVPIANYANFGITGNDE